MRNKKNVLKTLHFFNKEIMKLKEWMGKRKEFPFVGFFGSRTLHRTSLLNLDEQARVHS